MGAALRSPQSTACSSPPQVNGVPCLANSFLIDTLHNWSGQPYYPYISTDGGNMIDSMVRGAAHIFVPPS